MSEGNQSVSQQRQAQLDVALAQIEKQFGSGAAMRLGDREVVPVPAISTSALALDLALGVGGLPRGRVVEIYGPESSGCVSKRRRPSGSGRFCSILDPRDVS